MTNEEFIESIRLEGEEWKTTTVSERYAVSSFGRVVSYALTINNGNRTIKRGPLLLKPRINKLGYYRVSIYRGKRISSTYFVHRLVALAFIDNPDGLPSINHKDENPGNNRVENLEWCTQKYNCNYGSHNLKISETKRKWSYQSKPVVQLSLDGTILGTFPSAASAARSIGANIAACIARCCKKQRKTCNGFMWMYMDERTRKR